MVLYIRESFLRDNLMEKESIPTSHMNKMISSNIRAAGKILSRMDMVEPHTIMEMYMKEISLKDRDVEMVFIGSTKFTNMLVSGKRTVFGERESFIEIKKFSLKASLKKV